MVVVGVVVVVVVVVVVEEVEVVEEIVQNTRAQMLVAREQIAQVVRVQKARRVELAIVEVEVVQEVEVVVEIVNVLQKKQKADQKATINFNDFVQIFQIYLLIRFLLFFFSI